MNLIKVKFEKGVKTVFYGLIAIFLSFDIGTKRWMAAHLDLGDSVLVIPGWLSWKLIHNEGATFGIFSNYTGVLIGISFFVILFVFYLYWKSEPKSIAVQLGFALLLGGAIGNFIDRIWLLYVVDFIEIRWWPAIFNVADLEIRGGTLLLIYLYLTKRLKWE
jgi:signal peptidase II